MDWIEQLFGLSPDGGSGATEAIILISISLAVSVIVAAQWQRRHHINPPRWLRFFWRGRE